VPDPKPLLVYDGNCGFCKIWIDYWKQLTGDRVQYAPSQEVSDRYPQISGRAFAESVQLVRTDGSVVSGARAVFETLGREKTYESSRLVSGVSEWAYRLVAGHREFFYRATKYTFGTRIEPARFAITQWIFLRALAVIYGIAFLSLAMQITGLIGEHGILPLQDYLEQVAKALGGSRFYAMPTVFWWGANDHVLEAVCWAGVALSVALLLGRLQRLVLILLFLLYLSLSTSGQDFLSFQWDALLLEAGFLAIFLGRASIVAWLFRLLVFRLNFLSGSIKLLSHDPAWKNLSALDYHFHTQPLPNFISWYADKLPRAFLRGATLATLVIEIAAPFLMFAPRRIRMVGAWCLIGLQILILGTGNYGFFNYLTIALCLFLFDDQALRRWVPARMRAPVRRRKLNTIQRALLGAFAAWIAVLGFSRMVETFTGASPEPLRTIARVTAPFQIVNSYGLFAVMTTQRPEIIVEGSADGENWQPYEFKFKPGDRNRRPRWAAPYQPRLDWQMWFAALSNYRQNLWFVGFALRLLQDSPAVVALMEKNPFSDHPPRYIRALVYEYTFTDAETRRKTGAWWRREPLGTYLPAVGLKADAALR
jgi:predicted DCC family thiol-disulfide oxidoreductase YuxK